MNEVLSPKDSKPSAKSSKNKTSLKEFMKPWGKLCAAYPRYDLSKATVMTYYERLARFPVDKIMRAVEMAIDDCVFFPTVAELRQNIATITEPSKTLLEEPRPSKEETAKILENLGVFIKTQEQLDNEKQSAKIRERKALLRKQAVLLNGR